MQRLFRLALLPAYASLVVGFAACGRSDLFSERHSSGSGGNISIAGGGGRGGAGGSADGRGGVGGSVDGRGGQGGSVAGRGGTTGTAGRGGTTGTAGRGGTGGVPNTCSTRPEICNNGVDDNCNNLSDCADPGCFGDPRCAPLGQEVCNNNLDDDADGRIDCADADCMNSISCRPTMGMEICDNRVDDNSNSLVDCADPQCTMFPGCLAVSCTADVDFGTIATHGANVTRMMNTVGDGRSYATCAPSGGVGRVGRFQLDATADVRLDFKQGSGSAHAIGLFRAGANQTCDRNPVDCVNAMDDPSASKTFPALAPGVYWIIVGSYLNLPGTTSVTLSTGSVVTPEICANGRDDDGNGLTDCQDAACSTHASCIANQCVPDLNVGTLVVDGPARSVTVDTRTATDDYSPTCAGGVAGGDIAIEFTLAETAGLEVEFQQTGRSLFSVFRFPAPGLACDANQVRCSYQDDARNAVAFLSLSAGRYVFIVKAQSTALGGTVNLRMSAFGLRPVEICGNSIDDDNDGLTDCDDPECFGLAICPAPACTKFQDLGNFSWGTRQTLTVDTRDGLTLWPTSCSRGTGKEKVLRVNLLQPMSLGFDCMDGGSHVLAVARQLQPLDACNANQLVCVDPAVLPFGCGYSLPNLQPGQYNVIVQAFQAGNEGLVNLTLSGIQEILRETCDNGIDDDNDGATDCADRKCVTEAVCRKFACRAEQMAGILPLDGSLISLVVQTAAAGDDQMRTSCASAPGGQDGVIDFQVPAVANVSMQWAQVGDHDFALYDDEGMLLACDAGTPRGCVASAGVATGTHVFPALPPGRYHLVVDADRPGKEGGVVVQLSAVASSMP